MSGSPLAPKAKYKVVLEKEASDGLSSLPESAQNKVLILLRDHVQHTPKLRIPAKLKELKAEYAGSFQYDITERHRMIYTVDDEEMTVYVEYIGDHPNWKRRKGKPF